MKGHCQQLDVLIFGDTRKENEIYQGTARDPGLPYHTQGSFLLEFQDRVSLCNRLGIKGVSHHYLISRVAFNLSCAFLPQGDNRNSLTVRSQGAVLTPGMLPGGGRDFRIQFLEAVQTGRFESKAEDTVHTCSMRAHTCGMCA